MQQLPPGFQLDSGPAPAPTRAPGIIRGAPKAPDPAEQQRLAFEAERIRLAQQEEARKQAEFEKQQNPAAATGPQVQAERRARINTSLKNLKDLERMVRGSDMGTGSIVGQESFRAGEDFLGMSGFFNQTANDVAGAIEMVQGDLINQVRNEMQMQGAPIGARGADTEKEASRLAASIANLAQTQDEEQFLVGVQRAREYYLRRFVENGGNPGELLTAALNDGATYDELESYAKAMGVELDRDTVMANIRSRDGGGPTRNFEPDPNGGGGGGMMQQIGAAVDEAGIGNTLIGYAQGAAEAAIDLPQTIGALPQVGMNSLIGGARAAFAGNPQDAARIRAETQQMNDRVWSLATPANNAFNALAPAPQGYETQRDVARFAGGFLVPGPKGARPAPRAPSPAAPASSARSARGVIDNAAEVVAEGERRGVPVMRTDIQPPKSGMGRFVKQTLPEKIPVAGTSGPRQAQQEQRIRVVGEVLEEFGGNTAGASGQVEDIARALGNERVRRLGQYKAAKDGVIDGIAAPFDAAPNTVRAITEQVRTLREIDPTEFQPVIERLQRFGEQVTSGAPLRVVEEQRKLLGAMFDDPNLAKIRDRGQKAINAIYDPLRRDMGDFIEAQAGPSARAKWAKANEQLAGMAGELKSARFRNVLRDADVTPEAVGRILFGDRGNVSDMKRLVANLPPAGRKKVQAALIQRAFDDAGGQGGVSVERFLSNLDQLNGKIGVAFEGADRQALEGVRRLLNATRRGAEAGANVRTGEQNLPAIMGIGATQALGAVGGIGTLGVGGLVARIYESPMMRNRLLMLAKAKPGSPQERKSLDLIMRSAAPIITQWRDALPRALNDNPANLAAASDQQPE